MSKYTITMSAARKARLKLAKRGLWSSLALVTVMLPLAGLGFWLVDPNIHSIGDGMWLAFVTASTVGYGDIVPSNGIARFFAMVVVMVGFAVLSLVTASLSTIFVQKHADDELVAQHMPTDTPLNQTVLSELHQLRTQITALQATVDRLTSSAHEKPGITCAADVRPPQA